MSNIQFPAAVPPVELGAPVRAPGAMLTVNDVAERTRLSAWWVRRLINSGELRAINISGTGTGARWRIDPEDLRGWLTSRENRHRDLVVGV